VLLALLRLCQLQSPWLVLQGPLCCAQVLLLMELLQEQRLALLEPSQQLVLLGSDHQLRAPQLVLQVQVQRQGLLAPWLAWLGPEHLLQAAQLALQAPQLVLQVQVQRQGLLAPWLALQGHEHLLQAAQRVL
jgi:hypothetical protein